MFGVVEALCRPLPHQPWQTMFSWTFVHNSMIMLQHLSGSLVLVDEKLNAIALEGKNPKSNLLQQFGKDPQMVRCPQTFEHVVNIKLQLFALLGVLRNTAENVAFLHSETDSRDWQIIMQTQCIYQQSDLKSCLCNIIAGKVLATTLSKKKKS